MAKRRTMNRMFKTSHSRRYSKSKSFDSANSGYLDSDTNILGEEDTYWWNNLENSSLPHSLLYDGKNETTKQLSIVSQSDSSHAKSKWWKNLESSDSEHNASTSSRQNLSGKLIIANALETSISDSGKESDLIKRKVLLKATSKKSEGNAFLNALNDTETVPVKQVEQVVNSALHSDNTYHERKIKLLQLESNEAGSSNLLTPKAQNVVLENNPVSDVNKTNESSDNSDTSILREKFVKPKSLFIQRARENVSKNAFEDALVENNVNSPSVTRSSLSPSKRSLNRSMNKIDLNKNTSIHKSQRLSLNSVKKQSLVSVQDQDNTQQNMSSSSLDNNESRRNSPKSLKPKSIILRRLHNKSITKNPFEEILGEVGNVRAQESNTVELTEDNHIFFEQNESSATRISREYGSLKMEKDLHEQRTRSTSKERLSDIALAVSSSDYERSISRKRKVLVQLKVLGNHDIANISKSISQKNTIADTPEKRILLSSRSTRNLSKTLKKRTRINSMLSADKIDTNDTEANSMLPADRVDTNETEAREIMSDDNSFDDANKEQNTSTLHKQLSKSSSGKKIRLTRNSLRNRSETPTSASKKARQVTNDDDSFDDANKEQDTSTPHKKLSKSSSGKEVRSTRNSSRNRSETPKSANKGMTKLFRRSVNWSADTEKFDNVFHKNTTLPDETKATDDEDETSVAQTIQRKSSLLKSRTNKRAIQQTLSIAPSSNRTNVKENKEISHRQKNLSSSQNYHVTPIKTPSRYVNTSNINSVKTTRTIDTFFKVKQPFIAVNEQSTLNDQNLAPSQGFNAENMKKINTKLEEIKSRERATMKMYVTTNDQKKAVLKTKNRNTIGTALKQGVKKKKLTSVTKVVDKAFLVNGKIYKAPKLRRPKHWATDHLYKFLWKYMEPKYKLSTRVKSEKFVQELATIVSIVERRNKYDNYKTEIDALMMEMARLGIINTCNGFYNFCQEFLPYNFRVKVVPMLLPGNKRNVPYNPDKLHTPLLNI